MRTKTEIFHELGFTEEYNPHGGIVADTKELIFAELLIDIRDTLLNGTHQLKSFLEQPGKMV